MKLCAFDLETTGLDPYRAQILQIAAVAFDSDDLTTPVEELPSFNTYVEHRVYEGDAYALAMNSHTLYRIADGAGISEDRALADLANFLWREANDDWPGRSRPTPVGFNVAAFDVAFLKARGRDYFHYRPIELGSLLATPEGLSNTNTELTHAILGREVTHCALQDARDAVSIYRHYREVNRG